MKKASFRIPILFIGIAVGCYGGNRYARHQMTERENNVVLRENFAVERECWMTTRQVFDNIEIIELIDSGQITNAYKHLIRPIWGYNEMHLRENESATNYVLQKIQNAAKKYPLISNSLRSYFPP